ncbi:hypothetical protein [Streptomyces sp. NPDC015131]|uniref:hypothetical protein n=1 Tax=Streptomyces sp. NPDC015131 TaxID=3364941 RepID=UPI0036FA7FD5
MDHKTLGIMWERAKRDRLHLVVTAVLPSPELGCNVEMTGHVIGRGSKYSIYFPGTREFIEDVRAEWITDARLIAPSSEEQ